MIGHTPIPAGGSAAIAFGNIAFTTVGFIISGCLSKKHRFKHGFKVSLALWILSLVNVFFFGATLATWLIAPVVFLACMAVGVGISFLLVKTPKGAADEEIESASAPDFERASATPLFFRPHAIEELFGFASVLLGHYHPQETQARVHFTDSKEYTPALPRKSLLDSP
ncbi:hypothetical protein [Varunaivibrio sulfuroxidans]|uniref:hypothetical protein n=1 Tax=Varunaivibrio sulfuroxidans TaxID=1773489 RepID=UPI00104DC16C|nr:hypothetical protein [Varunaivibrio sulfuroxidans]WES29928.1 hypothetical protein P3M64_09785 [Varunaivibrio sulfuroxidans]